MLLQGKTALITGAARGIGKAIAMKFATEGANIAFTDLVLNDDMAAGLEATRKEIEALGVKCLAYAGNAADFSSGTPSSTSTSSPPSTSSTPVCPS